jgi:UDP-N-acetylmuramate--alanine ligase
MKKPSQTIYFVGIKGVAMTALALYCKGKGMGVSGSDVADEFPTDALLASAGITVLNGFSADHIDAGARPDLVIYTGAHGGRDNPEVVKATALGIPVMPHGKALGTMMEGKRQIVVAGSHGKTTTSALVATILRSQGAKPSYAIGCGGMNGSDPSGAYGEGDWFVAEGDEYITDPGHDPTPRFLWTRPEILVVTNIDFDHPDAYKNLDAVKDAFTTLTEQLSGQKLVVVNCDDPESAGLLASPNVMTYGFSPRAAVQITHVSEGKERMFFTLSQGGVALGEFAIKIAGNHNVMNATAAAIAAHAAGLTWDQIREGLLAFTGTKRRFERVGRSHDILFYDDYAHHPQEIEATLRGAKLWYPDQRIIAVFQPHTYSRTKALLSSFGRAFHDAHSVILTDIYASAREHDTLGITGTTLVEEVSKQHPRVYFANDASSVARKLHAIAAPGDVVIFMGAGDIFTWGTGIAKKWETT